MGLKCAAVFILLSVSPVLFAQCAENNYVHDGAPSSQLDCQPLAALQQVSPDAMAARDQQLVADRHAGLVAAARFYGFEIDDAGWSYQQAISPLLRRHILLTFTNATPANRASRFIAIVPADSGDKVQVVPAFARGLHPYLPGWQSKGSVSAFNRLMNRERGVAPISHNSDWIDYAVLYLTLAGRSPSIPTETDSVKANWDLSVKRERRGDRRSERRFGDHGVQRSRRGQTDHKLEACLQQAGPDPEGRPTGKFAGEGEAHPDRGPDDRACQVAG